MRLFLLLLVFSLTSSAQPYSAPEDWKCNKDINLPGGIYGRYAELMKSECADLKDNLNNCCAEFENCKEAKGLSCVAGHKTCNMKVVSGHENEKKCSAIAEKFIQGTKGFACVSRELGGANAVYHTLSDGPCKDLTDRISDCCAEFNRCDDKHEFRCVEKHEECNSRVVSGRDQECVDLAGRLIRHDRRMWPDKDWQCKQSDDLNGSRDQNYRNVVSGNCLRFKDGLNNCCAEFNNCKDNSCVAKHKTCNMKVVPKSNIVCTDIAEKLIRGTKGFACVSKELGGANAVYHTLSDGPCKDLTDRISDCCAEFNRCDERHEFGCVEKHEECNSRVVSGRDQECVDLAGRLIRQDRRQRPDKNWKCKQSGHLKGSRDQNYRDVVSGRCLRIKDGLSQCCEDYNICSEKKGESCIDNHKSCNSKVIIDRESDCSVVADRLVKKEQEDPPSTTSTLSSTPSSTPPPTKIIVYIERIVVYANEQMEVHPIRFWLVLTLTFIAVLCFTCGICCLCCAVVAKAAERADRTERAEKNNHSSKSVKSQSRAESVRSDSGRN